MYGLDRAGIFVEVETDILFIKSKIESIFPNSFTENTRKTKTYSINQKNINKIKVEESYRGATLKKTVIKIDFSYPRYKNKDNVIPITTEKEKIEVEEELVKTINTWIDYSITRKNLQYEFIEFSIQEKVGTFYTYHNIISFFYRALSRKYEDINKVQYYNFSTSEEKHYTTGFIFQPFTGWKIRLYSKGHEHNRNHENEKIYGAILRLEHRLSRSIIRSLNGTIFVSAISIEHLKEKISEKINKQLYRIIIEEIEHSFNMIYKVLNNFKSRELSGIIRDNLEFILDEKIIDDIITNTSQKSYPQIKRYRAKVRQILLKSQAKSSPKREFFGNIERLEIFLNNLLFIPCKVECNTQKHLTFSITKKYHNCEPFLTIPKNKTIDFKRKK